MKSSRHRHALGAIALLSLGLAACAAAPTSPTAIARTAAAPATPSPAPPPSDSPSSNPVIANLTASFTSNTCTRAADGLQAMALVLTFDYTDPAGDLSGGRIPLNRLYNTGRSESHTYNLPAADVTMSGTPASGEITITDACPLYDNNSSETETVALVDGRGNTSNNLSITVSRPAGDR